MNAELQDLKKILLKAEIQEINKSRWQEIQTILNSYEDLETEDAINKVIELIRSYNDNCVIGCLQAALGNYYILNDDYENALKEFESSILNGNPYARGRLASCYRLYYKECGVEKDEKFAFELNKSTYDFLKKTSPSSNVINYSADRVAYCYYYGKGVKEDKQKARKLWKEAADYDYEYSMYNLAIDCFSQKTDQSMKDGFALLKKAVQINDEFSWAYYSIGVCYSQGLGTDKDEDKATEYFEKAASQDEPALDATRNLAIRSFYNAKDKNEAKTYLFQIINDVDDDDKEPLGWAYYNLGNIYYREDAKDAKRQAYKAWYKATEYGNWKALFNSAILKYLGTGMNPSDHKGGIKLMEELIDKAGDFISDAEERRNAEKVLMNMKIGVNGFHYELKTKFSKTQKLSIPKHR